MKATKIQPADQTFRRGYSPEEKAALTFGRLSGRISLAQQDYLAALGVPRSTTVRWTRYRASQEIKRRTSGAQRQRQPAAHAGASPAAVRPGTLTDPGSSQRITPPGQSPGSPSIQAGQPAASPCRDTHGGRGNHQHPPQVNLQTEKAAARWR